MNSVFQNIQFTTEIPSEFKDDKLPTLDFAMWIEEGGEQKGKIKYTFYEKEMGSKYCIMEKGAMPENTKNSTLSQEIIRRMMNTSELVSQGDRNQIVENFIVKMRKSGYNKDQIRNIVISGLKGYQTKLERSRKEGKDLHRDARSTAGLRYKKKLLSKANWFKQESKREKDKTESGGKRRKESNIKKKKTITPATVLFVPRTPGGELSRMLRTAEQEISNLTGDLIKIVERSGTMVKSKVHKSNPLAGENCFRDDCLICRDGDDQKGDCRRRNILYFSICQECKSKGKEAFYIGESSRSCYERGKEHHRDFINQEEDSHMFWHQQEEHGEKEDMVKFSMKVVQNHQTAFRRQIHEAVSIARNSNKNLLNSKQEYNRCILPRLTVMMGDSEARDRKEKIESKRYEVSVLDEEESILSGSGKKRSEVSSHGQPSSKRRRRWKQEEKEKSKRKRENEEIDKVENIFTPE